MNCTIFSNLHIIQSVRKLCIFSWLEQLWKKKVFFWRGWGAGAIVEKLPRSWFLSFHPPPPFSTPGPSNPQNYFSEHHDGFQDDRGHVQYPRPRLRLTCQCWTLLTVLFSRMALFLFQPPTCSGFPRVSGACLWRPFRTQPPGGWWTWGSQGGLSPFSFLPVDPRPCVQPWVL